MSEPLLPGRGVQAVGRVGCRGDAEVGSGPIGGRFTLYERLSIGRKGTILKVRWPSLRWSRLQRKCPLPSHESYCSRTRRTKDSAGRSPILSSSPYSFLLTNAALIGIFPRRWAIAVSVGIRAWMRRRSNPRPGGIAGIEQGHQHHSFKAPGSTSKTKLRPLRYRLPSVWAYRSEDKVTSTREPVR
jgi:hypothetical protein